MQIILAESIHRCRRIDGAEITAANDNEFLAERR